MLSPYRILDLCSEHGHLCGKLLGDLGARVVPVEQPGGAPARFEGPYLNGQADPEQSLSWLALNTSKKGVTLELTKAEGQELFLKLVAKCDAVVESYPHGYLDNLGLGYEELRKVKPDLVMTSITPFGDRGPYSRYQAGDLVVWALSGLAYICGDPDRRPVRISLAQTFLHVGADAAAGTVMALYHRGKTGKGQRVKVSAIKAMERVAYTAHTLYDARSKTLKRSGSNLRIPPMGTVTPLIWPCADGHVAFYLFGGNMGAVSNPALTAWMGEQGLATETMKNMDWPKFDIGRTPQEEIDEQIVGPIGRFFKGMSQKELWEQGVKRRVMVYPVNDVRGVLSHPQLAERDFWVELEHPVLGASFTYPGAFLKTAPGLCQVRGPAPSMGQDNEEIYSEWTGLSDAEIAALAQQGII